VRNAQKAFRQRKDQHATKLEERCRVLEGVVGEMSEVFMGFCDGLLARGVQPELVRGGIEGFLGVVKRVVSEDGADEASTPSDLESPPSLVLYQSSNSALPDPFLNNSLWTRPSPSNGSSAIPYILAGRDSFSSHLYFSTIVFAVQSLQNPNPQFPYFFRYKMRYSSRAQILTVVSGVLDMMLHGSVHTVDGERTDAADEEAVTAAIIRDVEAGGKSRQDYLSSREVERYLSDRWGLAIDSTTIRIQPSALLPSHTFSSPDPVANRFARALVFAPTLVPGFEEKETSVMDARVLVERLKDAAVTIGQGPRWHFMDIDEVVGKFLGE